VIVGHDELDAVQIARFEPQQKISPARAALAIGELDRQFLAPAVPVDADRDQHRPADDDAGLAHPFVARITDQIRKGFGQGTAGILCQTRIQPLVDRADRRGREAVAAQLFGDRLHLVCPGRLAHTFPPAPARTLAALEQLGRKPPGAVLRHPKLKFANRRDQRPTGNPSGLPSVRPMPIQHRRKI
jgi:hypothetical protein